MAVSTKNRRKIVVGDREYLWRVKKKKGPFLEIIDPISRTKYRSGKLSRETTGTFTTRQLEVETDLLSLGAQIKDDGSLTTIIITPRVVRAIIETSPVFAHVRMVS